MQLAATENQNPAANEGSESDHQGDERVEKRSPAELRADLSEVERAIAQAKQDGGHQTDATDGAPDADTDADEIGETHDPDAPYGRKADGTPRLKRGRPSKDAAASAERERQRARLRSVTPTKAKAQAPRVPSVTPLAVVNYQAMGESVASLFFSTGIMVFGEEWAPDVKEGEPLAVAGAFRDYFKATGMRDLPPGFALCFVLGVYTLKRAARPTIKSKLQGFAVTTREFLGKLRFRRGQ